MLCHRSLYHELDGDKVRNRLELFSSSVPSSILINGRFALYKRLGGYLGRTYIAHDHEANNQVIVKLEHVKAKEQLYSEINILKKLNGAAPTMLWHGQEGDYNVLVIESVGISLQDLYEHNKQHFSVSTTLLLASELISMINIIHSSGIIFSNIAPSNILIHRRNHTLYAINFQRSVSAHVPQYSRSPHRFASIWNHQHFNTSYRDDMISIGYMLIYFLRGNLPWQGISDKCNNKNKLLLQAKIEAGNTLCDGLPNCFRYYFQHCSALKQGELPNYEALKSAFTVEISQGV